MRAGRTGVVAADSQRRAEVWKLRVAEGPLLSKLLALLESNREFILDVLLSQVLELRGGAEAAKLTMRSWQIGCMRCGNAGSTEAQLPSPVRTFVPLYPNPNPNPDLVVHLPFQPFHVLIRVKTNQQITQ